MHVLSRFSLVLAIVVTPIAARGQAGQPAIPSATAPARILTLAEALETALRESPTLRVSRLGVDAARERLATARAAWWPSLNASGSYFRQTGNQASRPGYDPSKLPGGTTHGVNDSWNAFSFGVTLTETLDLGRTLNVAASQEAAAQAAGRDLGAARQATWIAVVQRYYAVLAAQEMIAVAERTRDQARRYADRAKAMFAVGSRPRIDVVRTEADALNAEVGVVTARDSLAVAKSALLGAMGERRPYPFAVERPPDPDADQAPVAVDAAYEEALAKRPERDAWRARIAAQHASVRALWNQYFPTLAVSASATESGLDLTGLVGNWSVGATLNVPLLSALSTVHQVREAEANLAVLQANLEAFDLQVRMDVEQAAVQLLDARAKIPPLQAALEATREALALAEGRYEAGAGNYVELLDAQAALANAETNTVRARFDLAVARATWDRVLGRVPGK